MNPPICIVSGACDATFVWEDHFNNDNNCIETNINGLHHRFSWLDSHRLSVAQKDVVICAHVVSFSIASV